MLPISYGQLIGNMSEKKYKQVEVYDSTYGINRYERLSFSIGGDSIRSDKRGYACRGWIEDKYENDQVLHRGYYLDGQLKIYKNYYENGQLERVFKTSGVVGNNMQIFYPDGKLKSEIEYVNGNAQKWSDYFPNGQLSYFEENQKNMEFVIQRKSFFESGKPQSIFELSDPKKKRYVKIEYYENGTIKESGEIKFSQGDYIKDGTWKYFDTNGKQTSEDIYINGELNKQSQ